MTRLAAALVAFAALALPVSASADTEVIVLGIRSVESDDDLARNLTGALRNAVGRVPGWAVANADISLAQMTMVHSCDEPDASCMAQIAEELGQQRIVYGTIRRTGAGDDYNFALTLYFFNAETGQIEDSLTDNIPRIQTDIDDLRPRASRYVTQFSGAARYGSIRLTVNQPNASVSIDGTGVGVSDENGLLVIEDVAEGQREIAIEAVGFDLFSGTVRVVPDEQSEFRANLSEATSANLGWIPAVGLLAVGVGSLAAGTFAFWVPNIKDRRTRQDIHDRCRNNNCSADITAQRNSLDGTTSAALSGNELFEALVYTSNSTAPLCSQAQFTSIMGSTNRERAESLCSDQDTRKTLAIVFNVVGVAALGVGVALLLRWLNSSDDDDASGRFQLAPSIGRQNAGLHGYLEF